MNRQTCLLVVAKAPVAGMAKTRLSPAIGHRQAARLAAAALLDTMEAVLSTPDVVPVVALAGDLARAERGAELAALLSRCEVIEQRGNEFADRLANAHADVATAHPDSPVLQIGMDTPQVTAELLTNSIARLRAGTVDAVLGPAVDGGWWALGLCSPTDAAALRSVLMSRSDTGTRTLYTLRRIGLRTGLLPTLSDVDTMTDAVRVAGMAPYGRFARELALTGGRLPPMPAVVRR